MSVPQAEQAVSPEVEKLLQKREAVIDSIWKGDGFPTHLPDSVKSGSAYGVAGSKLTIEMKHGVNSISYLIHASGNTKNELVLYNHGHGSYHFNDDSQVKSILKNGYDVLVFAMPLRGQNSNPSVDPSPHCPTGCTFWHYDSKVTMQDGEKTKLQHHSQLEVLESDDFNPMSYFVEPIAVSLNYVDENFDYSKYHMIGISGGGWATAFYPAIDPRISHSFSVAGSHPSYSMTQDYEQRLQKTGSWGSGGAGASDKKVYQVADWKDLYVLASFGEDRKLTQWFHSADECCFAADELTFNYEETIKKRLTNLGSGEFEIFIEDTSRHNVSTKALTQFFKDIE
jgi:pimeloyl-ACP methyl ester carboxylesterase